MNLVLGLGNRLLGDDAAGPLAIDSLAASLQCGDDVVLQDGGTIGLGLLPAIEDATGFIAIDAARFGATAGTVRVFEGGAAADACARWASSTASRSLATCRRPTSWSPPRPPS
jgi:hydrogenase maturation protease